MYLRCSWERLVPVVKYSHTHTALRRRKQPLKHNRLIQYKGTYATAVSMSVGRASYSTSIGVGC